MNFYAFNSPVTFMFKNWKDFMLENNYLCRFHFSVIYIWQFTHAKTFI